jgi:hypothetical protein
MLAALMAAVKVDPSISDVTIASGIPVESDVSVVHVPPATFLVSSRYRNVRQQEIG